MHHDDSHHHHHDDSHHHEGGDHHDHHHDQEFPWKPGARSRRLLWFVIPAVVAAWLLTRTMVFVDQSEYAYVTTFGKIDLLHIEPGLKFKWPYQTVHRFSRRLELVNRPGSQMLTRERANQQSTNTVSLGGPPLTVEWYACWRIPPQEEAILQFWQSVGNRENASDRLSERIDAFLKAEVGQLTLAEFVNLDPSQLKLSELNQRLKQLISPIALRQFGVEIVDVRVKRFNYPTGVRPNIYEMIRTERRGVAERYRSEGMSEAAKIRSQADRRRSQIISKAMADAERLRGQGQARSLEILNAAYSKDPEFFKIIKTLDTYRAILNEQTRVILSADSELLKLLTKGVDAEQPSSSKDELERQKQ